MFQACYLIQCTLIQTVPAGNRPGLGNGERGDIVCSIFAVGMVVLTAGTFGNRGKYLQGNIALTQPGNINLTVIAALQQVSVPQQGIGMPVTNQQRLMQCTGFRRDRPGFVAFYAVHAFFYLARHDNARCD